MKIDSVKLKLDNKALVATVILGVALMSVFAFILPLWYKAARLTEEVRILDGELGAIRRLVDENGKMNGEQRPIAKGQASLAINEIMETALALGLDLLSTSPKNVIKDKNSQYPVLPLRLELKSSYKNLGLFLGRLQELQKSIVVVDEFHIKRDAVILPDIYADVTVHLVLKEGEGG
jgi:hypothetical protein